MPKTYSFLVRYGFLWRAAFNAWQVRNRGGVTCEKQGGQAGQSPGCVGACTCATAPHTPTPPAAAPARPPRPPPPPPAAAHRARPLQHGDRSHHGAARQRGV